MDIQGNDHADTFAKKGAGLHTANWAASAVQDLQVEVVRQAKVILAIGNVLAQWPSARQLWKQGQWTEGEDLGDSSSNHPGRVPRALWGEADAEPTVSQDPWEDEEQACAGIWGVIGLRME